MKIRKKFQGTLPENKILNVESTSQTDTYSCEYINNLGVGGGDSLDELPIGSIIKYDGENIPEGWEEVENISNNVYSTDETIIGTYYDGKPIYRKCVTYNFDGTYVSGDLTVGSTQNQIGIGVVDSLVNYTAFLYQPDLDRIPQLYNAIINDYGCIDYRHINMDVIQVGVKTIYKNNAVIKVVIEYTKTTD